MHKNNGQGLVELVVVVAVIIIVLGAIVFATISSIRNATAAKLSAQATKYAQEGLERVRSGRDRNSSISLTLSGGEVTDWQDPDLWTQINGGNCGNTSGQPPTYCFLKFSSNIGGSIKWISTGSTFPSSAESIPNTPFRRAIILSDSNITCATSIPCYQVEKIVTVQVVWKDFSGDHTSELTTILRKL